MLGQWPNPFALRLYDPRVSSRDSLVILLFSCLPTVLAEVEKEHDKEYSRTLYPSGFQHHAP